MRKLAWFSVGFAIACFAGAVFYGIWILLGAAFAFAAAGMVAAFRHKLNRCRILLLILLGCSVGLLWFGVYDRLFVLVPRVADGQILTATVTASDYSYDSGYGTAVEGTIRLNEKNYKVKAYLNGKHPVEPGDMVTGTFRFRLTAAGGEEAPTHHRTEGIFLLAYPQGTAVIEKGTPAMHHYPAVWRHTLANRIKEIFPQNSAGFASALLLGDRSGLDYEMNTVFKVSGISHIVAVSGLHVSILFALVHSLLLRKRKLSCLVGIPVLFLFAAIVGLAPSITRACIMQSLMLIAMATDQEYDPLTALGFAALVMLICNPAVILSINFQLSVGCMLGIFLCSPHIYGWLSEKKCFKQEKGNKFVSKLKRGVAQSISITLGTMIVTTPFVAYHFGCVSIVGVLTNLVTLWMIGYIFYGIILCLAMSVVSMPLAAILAWIVGLPVQLLLESAKLLSRLPMATVYTANIYTVVWLCSAYLMLFAFLILRRKQPGWLLCGIVVLLLISQGFAWLEPQMDNFRVTVLDVGQGQSILLQSEGKNFLVDCGGDDGEKAADVAAETLLSQGVSRLDGIIVTHYDADHTGGIGYLLTRIQTDRLILPDAVDEENVEASLVAKTNAPVEYVSWDMAYTFASTKMTLVAPDSQKADNENSICILFQREECDILITGDRGFEGEEALMSRHKLPQLDLLVVGHHGSAYSTGEKLLDATLPTIAVISVGENNRYGHPAKELLERLQTRNCEIYRTDLHGTIIYKE